jgi:hypothetical protein
MCEGKPKSWTMVRRAHHERSFRFIVPHPLSKWKGNSPQEGCAEEHSPFAECVRVSSQLHTLILFFFSEWGRETAGRVIPAIHAIVEDTELVEDRIAHAANLEKNWSCEWAHIRQPSDGA